MIKIDNLNFGYRKGQLVLKDVAAAFGPGIHLLLGPNGAGKTTFLKVLAGQLQPQSGACFIDGTSTANHLPSTTADIFLYDETCRFPLRNINEMAQLHAPFYPRFSAENLEMNLKAFGLTGEDRISRMSMGARHKAYLAYILSLGCKVLLLDEPANGLDIASKRAFTQMLAQAVDADPELCIIVATHTVQEMANLFDSVTILEHGTILINSSTAHITERLAFVVGPTPLPEAICFVPALYGPTQIIPNTGALETAIDYALLYTAAVNPESTQSLQRLLS